MQHYIDQAFNILLSRWGIFILAGIVFFGYSLLRSGNNPRP